jgi:DNA-binding NarL/FixJ family response regulator
MAIRIFIYDDSNERRESLKALLMFNDNLKYVGEATNCAKVLQDMEQFYPDVVLMDINMPDVDGIEGLKIIKINYPEIKVLMQTAFDDSDKIFTSIINGASGYILKKDKPQRILQAIEEVHQGGAALNPGIAQKVLDYFKPKETSSKEQKNILSPKETEVLSLLAEGLSYKMVADKLGVSYSTVNTHGKRIYEKLHISSLGEAIAYYYKNFKK